MVQYSIVKERKVEVRSRGGRNEYGRRNSRRKIIKKERNYGKEYKQEDDNK